MKPTGAMAAAVEAEDVRGGGAGTSPTLPWTRPEAAAAGGGRGLDEGDAVLALDDADGVVPGLDPGDGELDDGGDAVAGLGLDMPKGVDMAKGIVGLGISDGDRPAGGDGASLDAP